MGFLTTVTIKNDRLHEFNTDRAAFCNALFEAMNQANAEHSAVSVCGGYLTVQPSRHADDHTVFLHSGNTVFDLNGYGEAFEELMASNPKHARELIKRAQFILTTAKRRLMAIDKAARMPIAKAKSLIDKR